MAFLSFLVLLGIAYLIWRVTDQMPDLIFRLSEVQRDVAEIRRNLADDGSAPVAAPSATPAAKSTDTADAAPTSGGSDE